MKTTRRQGSHQGSRQWGRAQQQPREDPYELTGKPQEPARCPQCGASFHGGRWQWASAPGAAPHVCPACRRIADKQPAGILTLSGTSLESHKAEILNLVRHKEAAEKADHALNRIMGIEDQNGAVVITTTDIHLPRRIGEALKRAFTSTLNSTTRKTGISCGRLGAATDRPNDAVGGGTSGVALVSG